MGIAARFKEKHRTLLLEWMEKHAVTNWALAKHLRCSPMTVDYWKNNQALPDLVYAIKIERATRGLVSVESWVNTPYGRLRYADSADWQAIGKSGTQKKHEKDLRFLEAELTRRRKTEEVPHDALTTSTDEVDDEVSNGT